MAKSVVAAIALIFLGVTIAVFNPLFPVGSGYGPGWGDVLNGGAALLLLLAGAIVALVGALRHGRRAS
jgi:hypothetical protein